MKVVLLKDIPKIGQRLDVKEVRDGYARNFLFPHGLAEIATERKISELDEKKKKLIEKVESAKNASETEFKNFDKKPLVFERDANEQGHLFKGIGKKDIIEKARSLGIKHLKEDWIALEKPIKEVGEHEVKIKNPSGAEGSFRILVKK